MAPGGGPALRMVHCGPNGEGAVGEAAEGAAGRAGEEDPGWVVQGRWNARDRRKEAARREAAEKRRLKRWQCAQNQTSETVRVEELEAGVEEVEGAASSSDDEGCGDLARRHFWDDGRGVEVEGWRWRGGGGGVEGGGGGEGGDEEVRVSG